MRHVLTVILSVLLTGTCLVPVSLAQDTAGADSTIAGSEIVRSRLRPVDNSSPRATLRSFLDNMNGAFSALMEADRLTSEGTGLLAPADAREKAGEARHLFRLALSCLDMSGVPLTLRKEVGYEAALQLKETFDRMELPPYEEVPGDSIELSDGRWSVPNTNIFISLVEEGPREGAYLFSPRTVSLADDFYDAVKDLPYRETGYTTPGFYEFCVLSPGWLVPPRWNRWLPEWSKHVFLSHTIWQWVAVIVLLVLWVVVVVASFRVLVAGSGGLQPAARRWRHASFYLIAILTLLFVHVTLRDDINISGAMLLVARIILHPVWWFLAGAMVLYLALAVSETIIASPRIDPRGLRAAYYRALFGVLGFVGAGIVFVYGLSRMGLSLIPMLTGLGVGGIAVALAARPTLEGIISSFTIFADNPYRVGERVDVMGHFGTVESIGLRSTRIRLLNGHVTAIPNEKMIASEIENVGRRPHIRRTFDITIIYGTPPDRIDRAVEILEEILSVPDASPGEEPHPNEAINRPEFPPRVYFDQFNNDSLNLYVSYWYHPPEWWDYMQHAHRVNRQIIRRFNDEGLVFAFPTQTVHLAGGDSTDPEPLQGPENAG